MIEKRTGIDFDDIVESMMYRNRGWSQVCSKCIKKYKIPSDMLDSGVGKCICGVNGCQNEAICYIDFA